MTLAVKVAKKVKKKKTKNHKIKKMIFFFFFINGVPLKDYVAFQVIFRFCARNKKQKSIVG